MKTLDQIFTELGDPSSRVPMAFDLRNLGRFVLFLNKEYCEKLNDLKLGMSVRSDYDADAECKPFTEETIKQQLAADLTFAFEKALDKRSLSASAMHSVINFWLWVLEDDLLNEDLYMYYGLPLLKAVAVKYGLPNPIGDDTGDEDKYE